ncbi:hypothetical protein J437_LFUL019337 [Ladona fulva]|uniref:Uncharacterized protein n=1 Tax=Ladona fulva TaxID=123851 RepID=A0A8K0KQJ2_LADFU|nr:hypothetical protein J437_LFUL019337 [Ladona fulva]
MSALLRFCLLFALLAMIPSNADRSPYVPHPWNYPGLLPRFTQSDYSEPTPATTQRPRPQQRPQLTGDSNNADQGNTIGGGPVRNGAPCVECYIYITRRGEMIRVNRGNINF